MTGRRHFIQNDRIEWVRFLDLGAQCVVGLKGGGRVTLRAYIRRYSGYIDAYVETCEVLAARLMRDGERPDFRLMKMAYELDWTEGNEKKCEKIWDEHDRKNRTFR
jgi:hypothetical protein